VAFVKDQMKGRSDAMVISVISFPFGSLPVSSKIAIVDNAIKDGAQGFDCVANIGAIKGGDWDTLKYEFEGLASTANKYGIESKVIIETSYLTDDEKVKAALIAKNAGITYVKTCTGFAANCVGATVADIKLLKQTVGQDMGVKASSKIASYERAVELLNAGAHRLGTRAGVEVIRSCPDFSE